MGADKSDIAADRAEQERLEGYALQLMRRLRQASALALMPGINRSADPVGLRWLIEELGQVGDDLAAARYLLQAHANGRAQAVAELEGILLALPLDDSPTVSFSVPAAEGPGVASVPDQAQASLSEPAVPEPAAAPGPVAATATQAERASDQDPLAEVDVQELNEEIDALHKEVNALRDRVHKARNRLLRDFALVLAASLLLAGALIHRFS